LFSSSSFSASYSVATLPHHPALCTLPFCTRRWLAIVAGAVHACGIALCWTKRFKFSLLRSYYRICMRLAQEFSPTDEQLPCHGHPTLLEPSELLPLIPVLSDFSTHICPNLDLFVARHKRRVLQLSDTSKKHAESAICPSPLTPMRLMWRICWRSLPKRSDPWR